MLYFTVIYRRRSVDFSYGSRPNIYSFYIYFKVKSMWFMSVIYYAFFVIYSFT